MNTCPADPAPQDVKPCDGQPSEHGTGRAPGSGQEGLTLFESLVLENMRILIDQQDQIIEILMDQPEPDDGDAPPTHYLNGSRIS